VDGEFVNLCGVQVINSKKQHTFSQAPAAKQCVAEGNLPQ
jgi:hypothetical protein